jgi:hypothetical protein
MVNQAKFDYGAAHQADLLAQYEVLHAAVMAGPYASLQADIDDGSVWKLDTGAQAYLQSALKMGAVLAPPTLYEDGDVSVPAYWELGQGKGSVHQALAYQKAMAGEPE